MSRRGRELFELLSLPKSDCEAMLRTAVECYGTGNFPQAETILVGLIALNEADPRPMKLLASCLLLQDRHREAEHAYERALELDPQDAYTLVALGEIKLKTLNLAEAIPLFERLFALDPDSSHPAANRGRQLVKSYYEKMSQSR